MRHFFCAMNQQAAGREKKSKRRRLYSLLVCWVSAIILLQTLFFKFTAAPESVYIFREIGAEPWGRIGLGVLELITGALLLFFRTNVTGSLLCLFLMLGAILIHITIIGIQVEGDGGFLFGLAVLAFLTSSANLWLRSEVLRALFARLFTRVG